MERGPPQGAKKKFVAQYDGQKSFADPLRSVNRRSTSRLVDQEIHHFKQAIQREGRNISDPDDPGFIVRSNKQAIGERPMDPFVSSERQAMASITRELCDSQQFPQVLFFTEYGNQSPTPGDTISDFDMRCIYVGTLSNGDRKQFLSIF